MWDKQGRYKVAVALLVKSPEHGMMRFRIYAKCRGVRGRRDTAIGMEWEQVARLAEPSAALQVFRIVNFARGIGRDKQVAGGGGYV